MHGPMIVREFGFKVFLRCLGVLMQRRTSTFLSVIYGIDGPRGAAGSSKSA
jgi:hypothetical protein